MSRGGVDGGLGIPEKLEQALIILSHLARCLKTVCAWRRDMIG